MSAFTSVCCCNKQHKNQWLAKTTMLYFLPILHVRDYSCIADGQPPSERCYSTGQEKEQGLITQ